FESHGFRFDYGPHEFVTDNPVLRTMLQEVCGDDLITVTKRTSQHFAGRFVPYPFGIVDIVRSISPLLTMRAGIDVAWNRLCNLVRRPPDDSFATWTKARFGKTLYDVYFGPYTHKVWGIEPHQLDARTASDRITVDSVWDLVKKMVAHRWLGADDFKKTHSEFRKDFLYTRRGAGTLQNHLRRHIEAAGGVFEFGRLVQAVERDARGDVVALRFADGSRFAAFSTLVSTIPLPALVRMLFGERAEGLLAENRLPFRGMAFVFLRLARPVASDYHWIYFPDPAVPFQRTTEFGLFGADMSPPGTTGLALEVAMSPDEPAWQRSDAEIAEDCIRAALRFRWFKPDEVLGWDVVRTRHAYPVQVQGYKEKAAALLDAVGEAGNVISVGRQGLFRYCNQNECVEMALDVVPRMLAGERSIRYTREGSWLGVGVTDRYQTSRA
ncbi:MAG TPA: FAD-dependent oxidoreductase, partial [Planctomycetota bacterium]|nr:FAD-dependent oxidoreductase [Planctomycetota bacterium]